MLVPCSVCTRSLSLYVGLGGKSCGMIGRRFPPKSVRGNSEGGGKNAREERLLGHGTAKMRDVLVVDCSPMAMVL